MRTNSVPDTTSRPEASVTAATMANPTAATVATVSVLTRIDANYFTSGRIPSRPGSLKSTENGSLVTDLTNRSSRSETWRYAEIGYEKIQTDHLEPDYQETDQQEAKSDEPDRRTDG